MDKTRILIADDHFTVRLGLEMLVKDIIREACTIDQSSAGEDVVHRLQANSYDMLILDMNMPEPSGLQLLEKALGLQPLLKVLVVSVNPEDFFATKCLQLGAYGYVSKNAPDDELKKAIRNILAGKPYLAAAQKNKIVYSYLQGEQEQNPFHSLSARELDVAMLLLKGMGVLEIANVLFVTASTASTFKGRVFKKLNIDSLLELDRLARFHGMINDDSIQH